MAAIICRFENAMRVTLCTVYTVLFLRVASNPSPPVFCDETVNISECTGCDPLRVVRQVLTACKVPHQLDYGRAPGISVGP